MSSVYERMCGSDEPGIRILRGLLMLCIAILGGVTLRTAWQSLEPPLIYQRDLLQEYLVGRAVLVGQNPYLDIPTLADMFLPETQATLLPHPTPHPPAILFLGLPLALMSYQNANVVWFLLELVQLGLLVHLLSHWLRLGLSGWQEAIVFLVAVSWQPLLHDFAYGQFMILLLLLISACGLASSRGKPVVAGTLLGIAISLKFLGWPLVLYWGLKGKWRSVLSTLVVFLLANLMAAVIIGPGVLYLYYTQVLTAVGPLYQAFAFNFSPWTVGWRLLAGTGSRVLVGFTAPPLFALPEVASFMSILVAVLVFVWGLALALRERTLDGAFMTLVCLSVLMTPVTWVHYFTWLLLPFCWLGKRLAVRRLPVGLTNCSLLLWMVFTVPASAFTRVACILSSNSLSDDLHVAFLAGLVTYLQPLAVLCLMWLLYRIDRTPLLDGSHSRALV